MLKIFFLLTLLSSYGFSSDVESKPKLNGRIVGGTRPSRNDFLYKCGIYLYRTTGDSTFCSGSIISENFILTAAHCFTNFNSGTILAGVHDLVNEVAEYDEDFEKRDVIIHEYFNLQHFLNDIALINVTSNPFDFSSRIQRIRIASATLNYADLVGRSVRVSGWGQTTDNNQAMSNTLLFFTPLVLNTDRCREVYGGTRVTSNSVCLDSSDGRSTCRGDSGGGLERIHSNQNTLIGIVSFGLENGCQLKSPTVATFIPPFYNWISTKVGITLN